MRWRSTYRRGIDAFVFRASTWEKIPESIGRARWSFLNKSGSFLAETKVDSSISIGCSCLGQGTPSIPLFRWWSHGWSQVRSRTSPAWLWNGMEKELNLRNELQIHIHHLKIWNEPYARGRRRSSHDQLEFGLYQRFWTSIFLGQVVYFKRKWWLASIHRASFVLSSMTSAFPSDFHQILVLGLSFVGWVYVYDIVDWVFTSLNAVCFLACIESKTSATSFN